MTGARVRLDAVRFSYGTEEFFFDAELAAGEIAAIMGASGSGKTTLLNLVAGFETPAAGRVRIAGDDVTDWPPDKRPVTMVFQENNLFGHLDIYSNVGLGISPSLDLASRDRDAISRALSQTGLAGMGKRLPAELSGGERQRVALARALVRDRPVLILDEPFASLGPALRSDMIALVRKLHERQGMTILLVSHFPEDVRKLADRILFLHDRRIAESGPVTELLGKTPSSLIAGYLGDISADRY